MIRQKEISDKATEWNVPPDTVDKDYTIGHFFFVFYSFEEHKTLFVFKGGTCLRKCYFPDYRFSEDLDFTVTNPDFEINQNLIKMIADKCTHDSGILFGDIEIKSKTIHDNTLNIKEFRIPCWGANQTKSSFVPPQHRWTTKIELDFSNSDKICTPIEFSGVSHSRNPGIMRIFKDLEYIERLGSGIPYIVSRYGEGIFKLMSSVIRYAYLYDFQNASENQQDVTPINLQKNTKKTPKNHQKTTKKSHETIDEKHIKNANISYVNFDNQQVSKIDKSHETLDKNHIKNADKSHETLDKIRTILFEVAKNPFISITDLSQLSGLTVNKVRGQLDNLKNEGVIRRIGAKKGGYWEIIQKINH
jgi:ribosomal protein S25